MIAVSWHIGRWEPAATKPEAAVIGMTASNTFGVMQVSDQLREALMGAFEAWNDEAVIRTLELIPGSKRIEFVRENVVLEGAR